MTKIIIAVAALVLCLQPLGAADCVATTADVYVGLGSTGCTIGMLLFSNFAYEIKGFSTPVDPATGLASTQALITPTIDANGVGFTFAPTVTWDAQPTGNNDVEIVYQVGLKDPLDTTTQIVGIYDAIFGSIGGSGPPNAGFVSALDQYCPGGTSLPPASPCPGYGSTTPQIKAQINFGDSSPNTVSAAFLSAVTTVSVLKDMDANAQGDFAGLATITAVVNQFDVMTPEPETILLLGGGLMAILLGRRRQRRG